MKKLLLALLLAACPPTVGEAQQAVHQSGNVTPGHVPMWTTVGTIQDGGSAVQGFLTSVGVTAQGPSICINSALITQPYQRMCLGVNTSSAAIFSLQNLGGATAQNLNFSINGTTYTFPFSGAGSGNVIGPNSSNISGLALFGNTVGTLLTDSVGLGTSTTVLHGNASGAPSFASVAAADMATGVIRKLLATSATYYYRSDGSNSNTGLVNNAGGAFADPGFCMSYVTNNLDFAGNTVTCQAGETTPVTFFPSATGYVCSSPHVGGGSLVLSGNRNTSTVTITIASPGVVTWTNHGLVANQRVYFSTTGALPTGFTATNMYYVVGASISASTFQLSLTSGGTAINTSGSQSGVQTGYAITTAIDGTLNTASAVSIQAGCNLSVQRMSLKASVNSLECFGTGAGSSSSGQWSEIVWAGTVVGLDVYANRHCQLEQTGTDWITVYGGSGTAGHIQASHFGEVRNAGQTTNIVADLAYGTGSGAFIYGTLLGIVVYTATPVINLNGHAVTGQRCYAEGNGVVEQASLGATFFPGNSVCSTATGGQLFQ